MTKLTRFILTMVVFTFALGTLRAQSIYEPYSFGTLAGLALNSGTNDNTGSLARFNQPWGLAVDGAGNVYVADTLNQTIRKITPGGIVSTVAGVAGSAGFNDGASATALFSRPTGVAVNSAGTVIYVADYNNHLIRQISGGIVTTLAGSVGVFGTNDATGTSAQFHNPFGVALNSAGTLLYVADQNNQTIRRIAIPGGAVTTLAGAPGVNGSTDDPANNLNARFNTPRGIAVDGSGNVYVADAGNFTVRKILSTGGVSTIAGSVFSAGFTDGTGSAARFSSLSAFSPFGGPCGVAVDSSGNVYVTDQGNHTIRKITSGGSVTTLAGLAQTSGGADGNGSVARFNLSAGVAVDSAGKLYVADTVNHTIRVGAKTNCVQLTSATNKTVQCGSAWDFDAPTNIVDTCCTNFSLTFSTVTNGLCPLTITRTWVVGDLCGNTNTGSQTVTVLDGSPITLSITGSNNIFGAGHTVPPNPGGGGAGTLPPSYGFPAGPGKVLSFSSVIGTNTLTICCASNGADGYYNIAPTDINSWGGISGIRHDGASFLVGVFLDDNVPSDPAPSRLDFRTTALGTSFNQLSPVIGQTFFIGDGLTGTGSGSVQQFVVPPTATRLFLGLADARDYQGYPGAYEDNGGLLTATFQLKQTLTCATNKTVQCGSSWSFDPPSLGNGCSGTNNITVTFSTVTNGICPQIITRSWQAVDACGNTNTCSQTVTVVDTTPPTLTCSTNKTVLCGSSWTFDPPNGVDGCSGTNVTVGILGTVTNGICPLVITRTWLASDLCGNTNTCSQTVTVLDTAPITLSITGSNNIFGAGHTIPPNPGLGGAGTLPPSYGFPAGPGQVLTFSSVIGTNTLTICCASNGADGYYNIAPTDINSWGGISGIRHDGASFLVGVFLDDNVPSDPAPSRLDFRTTALGTSFNQLSPVIGQTFFIGDGLTGTGSGSVQQFVVPPTATRLFLGLADAPHYLGNPGAYEDNGGLLTATFQIKQTIACATNKTVECGSAWSFDPPTLWNGCSGTNNITVTFSTMTNGICPQIITRTWRAVDLCGNTNTCSQTVTVVDTTPPVFGCANPSVTVFSAGTTNDNFVGPEPAFPSAGLVQRLVNSGVSSLKGFDACIINTFFAHTFTNLPSCITGATLHIRLKGCGSNYDYDDTLYLGFTGTNGLTMPPSWGRYLGNGNGSPGLLNYWGNGGVLADIVLDLSQLPNADGSTTDLIAALNAQGFLDIVQQDDSSIDFAVLTVTSSCCGITNKTVQCGTTWSFDAPTATDNCSGTNGMVGILSTVTNGFNPQIITRTWLASDLCGNTNIYSQTVMIQCPANACVAAPTNMVLWLPFDETNGTVSANYVAGGNSGTQVGSPVVTSGYVDHSLIFNGNNYVNVPHYAAIDFGTNDFSIDAWVKRAANDTNTSARIIVDKRATSFAVTIGYAFFLNGPGKLSLQIADGVAQNFFSTLIVPNDGQWHHVAVTLARHNASGVVFYLDGVADPVPQNPLSHQGSVNTTVPLRVGSASTSLQLTFFGGIDEVELFSRVLTTNEIAALFNAGASGKCKNPCAIPLIVNCPTNKVVDCGSTNWSFDPPTATGIGVTITTNGLTISSNLCPKIMTQSWLVKDSCGNKSVCSQTVTNVDTKGPVFIPPTNTIPVALDANCNMVIPAIKRPVATDNCTPQNLLVWTQSPTNGTIVSGPIYFVTLTVRDACGNSSSCLVQVAGFDKTPPTVKYPTNGVTVTNCLVPNVLPFVSARDNCTASNALHFTQSPAAGTPMAAGGDQVAVTVSDLAIPPNVTTVYIPLNISGSQSFLNVMFNTGVGGNKAFLPFGTVDPHYTLGPVPPGSATGSGQYNAPAAIVSSILPPLPTPLSEWIAPNANAASFPGGYYTYTNRFVLPPGADPSTATLSGRWMADDGASMYLNGLTPARQVAFMPLGAYTQWTPFTVNSNFLAYPAVNNLYFVVSNYSFGATSLRVEFKNAVVTCSACSPPVVQKPYTLSTALPLNSLAVLNVNNGSSPTWGTPPLTMQWYHNNLPIANSTHYPGGVNGPTLAIDHFSHLDAGIYSISVANACGGTVSQPKSMATTTSWPWPWAWWNFAMIGNPMKATFGPDLMLTGMNTFGITSGTTDDYMLPGLGGQLANVLNVPALPGDSYVQLPFVPPASGDSVSNYTFIADFYSPSDATNPVTLFELSNPAMGGQVRLSTAAIAGIAIGGATYLNVDCTIGGLPVSLVSTMPLPLGQWNRVALAVENSTMDMDMDSGMVTLTLFLNGMNDGGTSFNAAPGTLAFNSSSVATVFSSPEGTADQSFVSSIQLHDMALDSDTMASIGSPGNGPIPASSPVVGKPPVLSGSVLNGILNISWSGSAYRLQETSNLTSGVWVDSALPFDETMDASGMMTTTAHANPTTEGKAKFYRLLNTP